MTGDAATGAATDVTGASGQGGATACVASPSANEAMDAARAVLGGEEVLLHRSRTGAQVRHMRSRLNVQRQQRFLDALALTCNVAASARHIAASQASLYQLRWRDAAFARGWDEAVQAGYDRLEMLILQYGGAGMPLDAPDAERALAAGVPEAAGITDVASFDIERALRILGYRLKKGVTVAGRDMSTRTASRDKANTELLRALKVSRRTQTAALKAGGRQTGNHRTAGRQADGEAGDGGQ